MPLIQKQPSDKFAENLPNLNPCCVIDVRSAAEFATEYLPGSINLPLDQLDKNRMSTLAHQLDANQDTLYLLCKSGQRATMAANKISQEVPQDVVIIEDGVTGLKQFGLIKQGERKTISLERQVSITISTLILIGLIANAEGYSAGIWLSTFVSAGMLIAGITGYCGMAMLLAKAPWNKS